MFSLEEHTREFEGVGGPPEACLVSQGSKKFFEQFLGPIVVPSEDGGFGAAREGHDEDGSEPRLARSHEGLLRQAQTPIGIAGSDRERPERGKGVGGQPLAPFIGTSEVGGACKFGAGERVVVFGNRDPTQRVVAPPDTSH